MNGLRPSPAALPAALAVAAFVCCGCDELRKAAPAPAGRKPAAPAYDSDYVNALASANAFCQAWQRRDLAAGKALLSRRLRRALTDTLMADAIVGVSNPRHAAFELHDGQPAGRGQYAFRVRLFHAYAGMAEDRIEAPEERIVVAREDNGNWAVDEFPMLVAP